MAGIGRGHAVVREAAIVWENTGQARWDWVPVCVCARTHTWGQGGGGRVVGNWEVGLALPEPQSSHAQGSSEAASPL